MPLTRRHLLGGALLAPVAVVGTRAASTVLSAVDAATRAARPRALGTTATRCAACGAAGHSMLDAACPNRPRAI